MSGTLAMTPMSIGSRIDNSYSGTALETLYKQIEFDD